MIVEQTSSVSFKVWDQLKGNPKRTQANNLKLAKLSEWEVLKTRDKRAVRTTMLAEPPVKLKSDYTDSDSDSELPPSGRMVPEWDFNSLRKDLAEKGVTSTAE